MKIKAKINILILGNGGREHSLVKKFQKSIWLKKIYAVPGNSLWPKVENNSEIPLKNHIKLVQYAKEKKIDLVVLGNENLLADGIVDIFEKNNILIFGCNKEAARIESEKAYSKELMCKYNIPTAKSWKFDKFINIKKFIENNPHFPMVLKSNNLAFGKGVVIARNLQESLDYADQIFNKHLYGQNNILIIEEFLEGEEFSLLCGVNGKCIYPLPLCRDYKRAFNDDEGPNTGGMGVSTKLDFLNKKDHKKAIKMCITPLLKGLQKEKINYKGILFAGIMKINDPLKPFRVIEYNVRWGDPETEIILEKINSDIIEFIFAILNKKHFKLDINKTHFSAVVVSAKGYPNNYQKNIDVSFIQNEKNVIYMGAKKEGKKIISTGGRIFLIWNQDENNPVKKIYHTLDTKIKTDDLYYRKDIK